jgi:uncharacterized cupredoxin-like copper-binding protein
MSSLKRWVRQSLGFALWLSLVFSLAFSLVLSLDTEGAIAAVAPSQQTPTEIQIQLGNEKNELVFEPNQLSFQAGKRYKLKLSNPSSSKHYFTAKDFAGIIWTQKVDAGNVEIKGAISELELRPSTSAEWVFIPMKPGTYQLRCSVSGHTEAGMVGELIVTN